MIDHAGKSLSFFLLLLLPFYGIGQSILSEKPAEVNKYFLPYDLSYTLALENKQFIQLTELQSNTMMLGRYQADFSKVWERQIDFDMGESVPEVFFRRDTIFVYSCTTIKEKSKFIVTFRYFDLNTGDEIHGDVYAIVFSEKSETWPEITFSKDKKKFIIYNYISIHQDEEKAGFQVFEIGKKDALFQYYLAPEIISPSKTSSIHLSDQGDVFFVSANIEENSVESYFWNSRNQEVNRLSSSFFFERQIDEIGEIDILRQSVSSYFVSFTSKFENELVGFNVTSLNVILKTVMFSHNQNLASDAIKSAYKNYYRVSENQMPLEVPQNLQNFRLVKSIINHENDVVLIFENLEIVKDFWKIDNNMIWETKVKKDKKYFGGDILMFCFSASGDLIWANALQKNQISRGCGSGLSFIERVDNENLRLLLQESSDEGGIFILEVNMIDGSLTQVMDLFPGRNLNITRKYSCWLDDNSLLICGIAPTNIYKRSLMLVEF